MCYPRILIHSHINARSIAGIFRFLVQVLSSLLSMWRLKNSLPISSHAAEWSNKNNIMWTHAPHNFGAINMISWIRKILRWSSLTHSAPTYGVSVFWCSHHHHSFRHRNWMNKFSHRTILVEFIQQQQQQQEKNVCFWCYGVCDCVVFSPNTICPFFFALCRSPCGCLNDLDVV